MLKGIKRSVKYFLIFIGILIMIPMIMYPLLRQPEIQTLIIRRITRYFSQELKSTVSVGKTELVMFNKLSLDDVLIKDKNDDTLIYVKKVAATIRKINPDSRQFTLGRVTLLNPVFSLVTDTTGLLNLNWYLSLLRSQEKENKNTPVTVQINHTDIRNGSFTLINRSATARAEGIDFNNMRIRDINGIMEDFRIMNDTTSFSIYNLSFRESGGFIVRKMNSDFSLADQDISFTSAFINCDSSILNIPHVELHPDSTGSYSDFTSKVHLDIRMDNSRVYTSDLRHFVPVVGQMSESVNFTGKVSGTVAEMRGRDITISYGNETKIDCDFDLSGLPDLSNSFIYLGINQLTTRASDLSRLKLPGTGSVRLPDYIEKMGTIAFTGSFTGFTTDFVAYGKLTSEAGNINTDISLRPEGNNRFKINGLVTGNSIALGEITGKKDLLGDLSMNADVDLYAYSFKKFSGEINGLIDSVEINKYKYRKISLNGIINDKTWDGSIKVADDNIRLDLLGMLNFNSELPEFDFTLNLAKADLYKLHLDKSDTTASASMLITANFKGNSTENLAGEVKLLNSNIIKYGNTLDLYDFSVRAWSREGVPVISLRTDYADADITGYFNLRGIRSFIGSSLSNLMPSYNRIPGETVSFAKGKLGFSVNFRNTDKINDFFRTGLLLADKSSIHGEITADTTGVLKMMSKNLTIRGNTFNDLVIDASLNTKALTADLRSSSLNFLGQSLLKGFSADFDVRPDNFIFNLSWGNNDPAIANRGSFTARGMSIEGPENISGPVLMVDIASSDIYSRNNLWKIAHSTVFLDSNRVNINKLLISNENSYYLVDGTLSENKEDTLHLEFKSIDISPLNSIITRKADTDALSPDIKGELNGKVLITDFYHSPLIEGFLKINGFSILGSEYGTLSLNSAWNNERKLAVIRADNNLNGKKMISVDGYYNPELRKLDLTALAEKLPVEALNPLLSSFASGITGLASGKVRLSGEINKLGLKGSLLAENVFMKIDYIQTRYSVNDSVRFDKNDIIFRNLKLADERGNPAILNGKVTHNHFKDFNADLTINFTDCMVLNTKPKDNEDFYGTAFGTGIATLKTGPNLLSFDISAKTGRNTRFYMPLNTSETVSDYSFVTFVQPDTSAISQSQNVKKIHFQPASTGIELNFDLEVTPDAEIQLIFDEKVGDVMKGRGSGNLNINLDRKGNLGISGDYIIENGDYLFTLGNVLNKPFSVENGGKVTFSGDVDNAEIDIKAIYRLKASLYEVLQDERFNERIPVECQILLTGKLFNPLVGFNIELPSADEERKAYLNNIITTEEELSRQFLYLLVMNSFYSDPNRISLTGGSPGAAPAGTTGTSAMAVTTTEMLSHQLSNWLSQISNDFDIGFVYRPGYKDINAQEVEVALSTQLLNDRVTINGNFDVRGAEDRTGTSDKITGDFDIEYKLTEKIRFKFFNRFNNPYTGKGAPYTQGFGLFFKEDFDKFSDLFRKNNKSEMKKEEEPAISGLQQ